MPFQQLSPLKNTKFILILILSAFFLKGLFWTALFPIFQGPDEQIHYATAQFMAEPKAKDWSIEQAASSAKMTDTETYNFSEEIKNTAAAVAFDEIRWKTYNSPRFSEGFDSAREAEIKNSGWKRFIDRYPPDVSPKNSRPYYIFPATLEKIFSSSDIFIRFFLDRIFSILLGAGIVFLSFLIFRKIGFSSATSLLGAAIISFQPMFSFVSAIVNPDIMLVFSFALYTFAAVSILRDGMNRLNLPLLAIATALGFFSKAPGIALAAAAIPLLGFAVYQKLSARKTLFAIGVLAAGFILALAGYFLIPRSYINRITASADVSVFPSWQISRDQYLEKTMTLDELKKTGLSYWGNFGWLDSPIPENFLNYILYAEIIGFAGVLVYLALKRSPLLPEKKFAIFLILMIFLLQIAIRFYDWRVFDFLGEIAIGTPGRYFMPNIVAHFTLLFIGFYMFLRKEEIFNAILKLVLVLMIGLNFYSIFSVIIPRYYL